MSKSGYLTADLIRHALLCAIRDRDDYAACDKGEAGRDAADLAADFRALLKRRYGEAPAGDRLDKLPSVNIHDIPVTK